MTNDDRLVSLLERIVEKLDVLAANAPVPSVVSASLTVAEARRALGCGKTRLNELVRDGHLDKAPRIGKGVRYTAESVQRLLDHGVLSAAPAPKRRAAPGRCAPDAASARIRAAARQVAADVEAARAGKSAGSSG